MVKSRKINVLMSSSRLLVSLYALRVVRVLSGGVLYPSPLLLAKELNSVVPSKNHEGNFPP